MTISCPNCHVEVKPTERIIEEAVRYQCGSCEYSKLEPVLPQEAKLLGPQEPSGSCGSRTATPPILSSPLQLKQKITTLAQGRLGLYLSQDVVRSLGLKAGQEVFMSIPDEKKILINI